MDQADTLCEMQRGVFWQAAAVKQKLPCAVTINHMDLKINKMSTFWSNAIKLYTCKKKYVSTNKTGNITFCRKIKQRGKLSSYYLIDLREMSCMINFKIIQNWNDTFFVKLMNGI